MKWNKLITKIQKHTKHSFGAKIQNIFVFIFVIALFFVVINNAFFSHIHQMPDGRIIVHAHPFRKSEDPNNVSHKHSKAELLFINLLNNIAFGLLLLFSLHLIVAITPRQKQSTELYYNIFKRYYSKRAPPILV